MRVMLGLLVRSCRRVAKQLVTVHVTCVFIETSVNKNSKVTIRLDWIRI